MGLIACPDCGEDISGSAATCIHCGRPMAPEVSGSEPAPGSATAAEVGRQRSRLSSDIGMAIAGVGIVAGIVIGVTLGSFWAGFGLAFVGIVVGVVVGYS